jgi:NADPH-dependent 2,4-dienoyl-CoA reductase/sulfur reductase-like enzyme
MEGSKMKVIVIGGVAAGMSAASKLRRLDPNAEIVVYEKGSYLSYGACGLPYYVSGANDDYRRMIIRTQEDFNGVGIKTHLNHEVIKVNPQDRSIMVKDLNTGSIFLDRYDKLMISTGAKAIVPSFKGKNLKGVYLLKSLEDGIKLRNEIINDEIKNVIIVGGGYIGIELAEAMVELGKKVKVLELNDRILTPFDKEISDIAEKELRDNNVDLHLGEGLKEILGSDRVQGVITSKGRYDADMVILSIGVRPATDFLRGSGIGLAKNGAIIIDREMRTNLPDIYSAGDCAEVYHLIKEENAYIPLGTTANKCGRIAGVNLSGKHEKFVGTLGSAAIKVLYMEMARTGLNEREAKQMKIDFETTFVKSYNHPGYYPNQETLYIKIVYEKRTHRILGAQIAGREGAVLRVDMFAIAIQARMTTEDIGMSDLCYAPPFSGVWDAVNVAANAVK